MKIIDGTVDLTLSSPPRWDAQSKNLDHGFYRNRFDRVDWERNWRGVGFLFHKTTAFLLSNAIGFFHQPVHFLFPDTKNQKTKNYTRHAWVRKVAVAMVQLVTFRHLLNRKTKSDLAHLQVHHPRLLENNDIEFFIPESGALRREIAKMIRL